MSALPSILFPLTTSALIRCTSWLAILLFWQCPLNGFCYCINPFPNVLWTQCGIGNNIHNTDAIKQVGSYWKEARSNALHRSLLLVNGKIVLVHRLSDFNAKQTGLPAILTSPSEDEGANTDNAANRASDQSSNSAVDRHNLSPVVCGLLGVILGHMLVMAGYFMANVAPHLPPPGTSVERRKDTQTKASLRAENAGGG